MIISHSSFCLLRVSLSCSRLTSNGGQERYQAPTMSLRRGKSIAQRRQDSPVDAVWVSIATGIPVRDLFAPPLLTIV
jgi:hypothetical protein